VTSSIPELVVPDNLIFISLIHNTNYTMSVKAEYTHIKYVSVLGRSALTAKVAVH